MNFHSRAVPRGAHSADQGLAARPRLRIVCPYCDPPWRCDTCDGAGFLYPDELETHQPNEARYADC